MEHIRDAIDCLVEQYLSDEEKSEHELKCIYCQLFINYFKGK